MHKFSPRRSACDRCRGHKLRCVRLDPGPNNAGVLLPCKRCVKARTECVHTAGHLVGKPPGETHYPAHHASKSSGHSAPFQQLTPVSDRRLSESSLGIPSAQSAPHRQTQSRGSNGSHNRPEDKEPLPPFHMFAAPTFSRSQLGFPKLSTHEDARGDHTADSLEVGPEATLAALPVGERTQQRSSRAPPDATTTFDLVDKVLDFDGRGFCPLSSPGLHDTTGAVTTATTTAPSTHPHPMLLYSQPEPLTPSSYFNGATGSTMTSGGAGSQGLRDQQIQQQQHHLSVGGRSSIASQDNCLHLLSQLSLKFMMDFGKSGAGDWSTMANNNNNNNNNNNHNHLSSTISKLFDGLQFFLKTVERLRPASTLENFSSGSECSYSDLCDESDFMGLTGDSQMQMHPMNMPPTDDAAPPPLDMPTTLTILTCYTWLLKGYEVVLSGIHEMLAAQDRLQGLQSLPAVVHGAVIGGFGLEDHPDMQIEMVIHIGWQLLQRIEGALGVQVVSDKGKGGPGGSSQENQSTTGDERGILDPKSAAAVLDSWFTNTASRGSSGGNGGDEESGDSRGCRRVEITRTITNIRKYLRSYWRDHNGGTRV